MTDYFPKPSQVVGLIPPNLPERPYVQPNYEYNVARPHNDSSYAPPHTELKLAEHLNHVPVHGLKRIRYWSEYSHGQTGLPDEFWDKAKELVPSIYRSFLSSWQSPASGGFVPATALVPSKMVDSEARIEINYERVERAALEKTMFNEETYFIRNQMANGQWTKLNAAIPEEFKVKYRENQEDRRRKEEAHVTGKAHFLWVVVNPKPETTMQTLQSRVEKYLQHKNISWVAYSYEQRSTTPGHFHGFHLNMLVLLGHHPPSKHKEGIFNCFKSIVGTDLHIHIKPVPADQGPNLVLYMRGFKKDNSGKKAEQMANDRLFRAHFGLRDIYEHNPSGLTSVPVIQTQPSQDEIDKVPTYDDVIPVDIRGSQIPQHQLISGAHPPTPTPYHNLSL